MCDYEKKILSIAFSLPRCFSVHAFNENSIPDEFSIKNCNNVRNCSFVMINGNKQAQLSYAYHTAGTFYFVDNAHQKRIIFRLRYQHDDGLYGMAHGEMRFDVEDQQGNLLAKLLLHNDLDTNFDLKIYQKNGKDLMAAIDTGLLGTEQTLYTDNNQIIAKLTRTFWTFTLDSEIKVMNKAVLPTELSPLLLMASLTLYSTHLGYIYADTLSPTDIRKLCDKLDAITKTTPRLVSIGTASASEIVDASHRLTQSYEQTFAESFFDGDTPVNRLEKLTRLIWEKT